MSVSTNINVATESIALSQQDSENKAMFCLTAPVLLHPCRTRSARRARSIRSLNLCPLQRHHCAVKRRAIQVGSSGVLILLDEVVEDEDGGLRGRDGVLAPLPGVHVRHRLANERERSKNKDLQHKR